MKHLGFLLLCFFLMTGQALAVSTPPPVPDNCDIQLNPPSHPDTVKRLHAYYTSERYLQDVTRQAQAALEALKEALARHQGKTNLAIVSDIDDTVLSTHDTLYSVQYGFYMPQFAGELNKGKFPGITPMQELMNFAKANNIQVFYVTGRTPAMQESTERNLKEQGFDYFGEVYYKPADYHEPSVVKFKAGAREQIESKGFIVLLSIGDQESDLTGGHAEKTIKLPNYMYFIP